MKPPNQKTLLGVLVASSVSPHGLASQRPACLTGVWGVPREEEVLDCDIGWVSMWC